MDKRIRELFTDDVLEKAAILFGSSLEKTKKVGGFENYIYQYNRDGLDYILRISHNIHRTYKQVESELDFVNYLASNQANVSVPVVSINNKLVETLLCEDKSYFIITSYIKAKGNHPKKENITDLFFENYGKTIGQFHQLTKSYRLSENIEKRIDWDEESLITEAKSFIPEEDQVIYNKFVDLITFLKSLPTNENNYGLIHTDVHMGNFFVEEDKITVFDFDDCSYQWFISDIAIALFYYVAFIPDEDSKLEKADHFMKFFMRGYQSEYKLDLDSYNQIPHFLKLREFILYAVVHRSCDLENDKWAQRFISMYKDRLLNDVPFINIDFTKYYK